MAKPIEYINLNENKEDIRPPKRKYSSRVVRISNILFFIVGFIVGLMLK